MTRTDPAARYARLLFERLAIAEADQVTMEERITEALWQNADLRTRLGLPEGKRCSICAGLAGDVDICRPCSTYVHVTTKP